MSDRYDPDERFSLWPMEAEDGLRRLVGADLPYVESIRTVGITPDEHPEQWDGLVEAERGYLLSTIPSGRQPAGDVQWSVAEDCTEPLSEGQQHWRFRMPHTR